VACKHHSQLLYFLICFYIFLTIFVTGLRGLNQAATNFYSFDQGRIAAYRLFEMISRSSSSFDHDGSAPVSVQGNIEFRNVYFSYLSRPEIPILSGFYLTVPAKKTVALVGRNGSGKSSIIPLMERFYDPTLGNYLTLHSAYSCYLIQITL
jgi:ATP-binding cassette, subfamily B (MDR/TAP), member 1